jgi:hypothetical protein
MSLKNTPTDTALGLKNRLSMDRFEFFAVTQTSNTVQLSKNARTGIVAPRRESPGQSATAHLKAKAKAYTNPMK